VVAENISLNKEKDVFNNDVILLNVIIGEESGWSCLIPNQQSGLKNNYLQAEEVIENPSDWMTKSFMEGEMLRGLMRIPNMEEKSDGSIKEGFLPVSFEVNVKTGDVVEVIGLDRIEDEVKRMYLNKFVEFNH
jgi:hypothetical protein